MAGDAVGADEVGVASATVRPTGSPTAATACDGAGAIRTARRGAAAWRCDEPVEKDDERAVERAGCARADEHHAPTTRRGHVRVTQRNYTVRARRERSLRHGATLAERREHEELSPCPARRSPARLRTVQHRCRRSFPHARQIEIGARPQNEPGSRGRRYGDVRLAIAVEVARHGDVGADAELWHEGRVVRSDLDVRTH